MKEIKITCDLKDSLKLSEFTDLQPDNFKEMSTNSYQKFRLNMLKSGFHEPIKVWRDNGIYYIVDGHHRIKILKKFLDKGYKIPLIPCYYVECDNRKEAIKMLLASNSHYAIMTAEGLDELLTVNEIDLDIFNTIDLTGHKIDTDVFLQQFHEDLEVEKDGDDVPDVDEENIITKLGDLWTLGRHRLLCGDCTVKENVDRLMDGKLADMVFTSPPYNANSHIDYGNNNNKKLYNNDCDNKSSQEYLMFCQNALNNIFNVCCGFIFWNVSYNSKSRFEYLKSIYPFLEKLHETIIWKKTGIPIAYGLTRNIEFIFCFLNGNKKHLGKEFETEYNFWEISNINTQDVDNHRAMFPIALVERGILLGSDKNEIILDPFLGSGTTIIAAEKTDRICYGMEIDPHYCDVIIKRYVDFTGDDPVRQDGAKWSELK